MSPKTKQLIFWILALSGVAKYLMIFLMGSVFNLVFYTTWMGLISIAMFIIFMWFLFSWAFKSLYTLNFLFILAIAMVSVTILFGVFTHGLAFGSAAGLVAKTPATVTPTIPVAPKVSKEDCAANAAKYDGKVLNITADGLKGKIVIKTNVEKCQLLAFYTLLMSPAGLPANHPYPPAPYLYAYQGFFNEKGAAQADAHGIGEVFPAYVNKGSLPSDVTAMQAHPFYTAGYKPDQIGVDASDTFFAEIGNWPHALSAEGYQEVLDLNIFSIVDAQPFVQKTVQEGGGFSFTSDSQAAVARGVVVKTYEMVIGE